MVMATVYTCHLMYIPLIMILLARLAMCLFIQFHSFSVGLGSAVEATCPFGWHLTPENTCIKLYSNTNTWANAQASCRSHGSQLVTLPNWRMINYVKGFLLSSGKYFTFTFNFGIIFSCIGNPNDAYVILSQILVGWSSLSQEYCERI